MSTTATTIPYHEFSPYGKYCTICGADDTHPSHRKLAPQPAPDAEGSDDDGYVDRATSLQHQTEALIRATGEETFGNALLWIQGHRRVPDAEGEWKTFGRIVHQPGKDERGRPADRFQFEVENTNGLLGPGEAERIAAKIVRDHSAVVRLVKALVNITERAGRRDCERYSTGIGSCFTNGRRADAKFAAEKCCASCIADAALADSDTQEKQ